LQASEAGGSDEQERGDGGRNIKRQHLKGERRGIQGQPEYARLDSILDNRYGGIGHPQADRLGTAKFEAWLSPEGGAHFGALRVVLHF